jgi:hypothetical protein
VTRIVPDEYCFNQLREKVRFLQNVDVLETIQDDRAKLAKLPTAECVRLAGSRHAMDFREYGPAVGMLSPLFLEFIRRLGDEDRIHALP